MRNVKKHLTTYYQLRYNLPMRPGYEDLDHIGPLTKVTPQQELFCECLVGGMTLLDAYNTAYNDRGGSTSRRKSAARDLWFNPRIQNRLKVLRELQDSQSKVTLSDHLERLRELGVGAQEIGQFSAAINAELNRGKASGLYVERKEITGANGGPLAHSIRVIFDDDTDDSEISSDT